jgi:hypothetical protein
MTVSSYIVNATNVHVRINGIWLDRAVAINAQQQATHQMIYGYMDGQPRRPVKGNTLVVGTIGIHHLSVDYLKRFILNDPVIDDSRANYLHNMEELIASFQTEAELLAYVSSLPLDSEHFLDIKDILRRLHTDSKVIDPATGLEASRSISAVDDDAFRKSIRGSRRRHTDHTGRISLGNTIQIVYGDDLKESFTELIVGVIFTGEAMSPIENTAGISADPAMRYFSFIASAITIPEQSTITQV